MDNELSHTITSGLESPDFRNRPRPHGGNCTGPARRLGTGSVYLRGTIWWVKYWLNGTLYRESTKSNDRSYAEEFIRARLANPNISADQISDQLNGSILRLRELTESSQCTIGAIAELSVSVHMMNAGYAVYRSMSHNAPCDLVAIKGDRTLRIEVKTITAGKRPTVNRSQFDHLALLIRGKSGIVFDPPLAE